MSTALHLDERHYKKLVAAAVPVVIHTETEYRRLLEIVRGLMERSDEEISEEEGRLLELLGLLIEDYEDRIHPLPQGKPAEMLRHLLEEKGMNAGDLAAILPKSRVSEILSGKRGISKQQARKLAELFEVSVELFL
ncbi:MAG TPA: helix-turn-helix domain-containing protein [Candidatus Sulfopaludibacter sp.]|jgi:HTH-type transcriptional regulator/antitoxin HigA|nr:helix-turn-helix domain-containing protein [Candidatus Sulfopaludibacter sp.]